MKFGVFRFFLLCLCLVSFTGHVSALSPPDPRIGKINILSGPAGTKSVDVTNYYYEGDAIYFSSVDQQHKLTFAAVWLQKGQKIKFKYEDLGLYLCSGTAIIDDVKYEPLKPPACDSTLRDCPLYAPPPGPNLVELSASFQGDCKWTDGGVHILVYRPLVGNIKIAISRPTDQCLDLRLENQALQLEIASIQEENAKLRQDYAALESQLKELQNQVSILKSNYKKLEEQNLKSENLLNNIRAAVAKTKANNLRSLKNLFNNLKALFVN